MSLKVYRKKALGYVTKEDFLRDAARLKLQNLSVRYRCVKVFKEKYERYELVIKGCLFLALSNVFKNLRFCWKIEESKLAGTNSFVGNIYT